MKRWQSLALGLIVTILSLAYALNGVPLDSLWDEFAHAQYIFLIPILIIIIIGLVFRALRWRALLGDRTTFAHSFNIMNVGYMFGALLPFRLGEVARMYLAAQLHPPISIFTTLSTIIVERLTDILGVVVIAALAISLTPGQTAAVATAAKVSGAIAIFGLVVLAVLSTRRALAHRLLAIVNNRLPAGVRPHLIHIMDRLLDGLAPIGSPRTLGVVLGWTGAAWAATVLEDYVMMRLFYPDPNFQSAFLMISFGALAVALPATPGSIGPFEAATKFGLQLGGMIPANNPELSARALACAVAIHVVNSGTYAVFGWIGLVREGVSLSAVFRSAQALTRRTNTNISAAPSD